MNVRVEYEPTPIRHIAVQCPNCEKWFRGRDITTDRLNYQYQIYSAQFECPACGHIFGADAYNNYATLKIVERGCDEVYKGCLVKKEVWEEQI